MALAVVAGGGFVYEYLDRGARQMIYAEISMLLALLLILISGYLGYLWRKSVKRVDIFAERHTQRLAQALGHLDRIFKRRTRLSADLIAAAAGEVPKDDFSGRVDIFLGQFVDDLALLFSDYSRTTCAVSIKLLSFDQERNKSTILTKYRDSDSARIRVRTH